MKKWNHAIKLESYAYFRVFWRREKHLFIRFKRFCITLLLWLSVENYILKKKQITWKFHLEFLDLSLQINYIFELLQRIYLAMQKLHNFEAL